MTHTTLLEALAATDMLEIDGLHTWQFSLDPQAKAPATADQPLARDERFLTIECMDGRQRREWHFSQAAVLAATCCAADGSWSIAGSAGPHRLLCMTGILADDEQDDAADDDAQAVADPAP